MLTDNRRLQLGDGPAADFIIAVEGKDWPVHKLIIFCFSDVLYKMSTNAAFTECQTGRVVLKDVEPRCVEAMVNYFYHQSYRYDYQSYTPRLMSADEKAPSSKVSSSDGDEEDSSEEDVESLGWDRDDGQVHDDGSAVDWADDGWATSPRIQSQSFPTLAAARLQQMRESDKLDFHLGVCMLAECYNIKGLKLAAENEIVQQHLDKATSYEMLSSSVDKIFDSDAPESLRGKVATSLIHQTQFLHSTDSDSLLDRQPELAVAVLKKIAETRHAKHLRDQKTRGRNHQAGYTCHGGVECMRHPSHPLCVDRKWPEEEFDGW